MPCDEFEGLRFCRKLAGFVRRILGGPGTPSVEVIEMISSKG
jgi:hypothetical protein